MRVPEHPAVRTEFLSGINLIPDFLPCKVSSVESIISECLQPGSKADGFKMCAVASPFKRQIYNFVGMRNRDSITGYPVLKP